MHVSISEGWMKECVDDVSEHASQCVDDVSEHASQCVDRVSKHTSVCVYDECACQCVWMM